MKNLFKINKAWTITLGILLFLALISSGYFIYTLTLHRTIQTVAVVTLALSVILLITYLLIYLIGTNALKRRKKKTLIFISTILSVIAISQFLVAHLFLNEIFNMIRNLNQQETTFTTHIVVKSDREFNEPGDLEEVTIGIINSEFNEEQTYASSVIIDDLGLSKYNEIEEYDNFISLISDLLNDEIDVALLPGGFASMFGDDSELGNLEEILKSIYSRTFVSEKNGLTRQGSIDEPFSVLIIGIDSTTDDISRPDLNNADTLMLLTVNPITFNTTILSIPRDSYVPIACFAGNRPNKIAHAGIGGKRCIIRTVEDFTDITIDYYVKIDFRGVVTIVDALDGIDVDVPFSFCEQDSQRRKGRHEICLEEGKHTLNGEQALALARHRRTIGDFERGYNNQLVLEAIMNEVKEVRNINTITRVLEAASNNMKTNFSTTQILELLDLAQRGLGNRPVTLQRLFLSGFDAFIFEPSIGINLYNFVLYNESIREVSNAMKENLGLRRVTLIKEFTFSANEPFESLEIGRGNFDRSDSTYDGRGMVTRPNNNNQNNTPTTPRPNVNDNQDNTPPETPEVTTTIPATETTTTTTTSASTP